MKTHQPKNVDANKEGQTADDAKKKTKRLVNFQSMYLLYLK